MQLRLEIRRDDRVSQESPRRPDIPLDLNEIFSDSGIGRYGFMKLMELLLFLFEDSFFLEFHEETRSLDVSLEEDEKFLILKFKKRTKSKKLTIGDVYLLTEKSRESSLTLVYELHLLPEQGVEEPRQRGKIKPIIKPVQPKLVTLDEGIPIESPFPEGSPDFPTLNPVPIFEDELRNPVTYEEKFGAIPTEDTPLEESHTDFQEYLMGGRLVRPDEYLKKYDLSSVTGRPEQIFEGTPGKRLNRVIIEKYDKPLYEDGELIYEKVRIRTTGWTTVLDAIASSGVRVSWKYIGDDAYIVFLNDHKDGDRGLYIEYKINGEYGKVAANKCVVPPGSEITFLIKTASSGGCPTSTD